MTLVESGLKLKNNGFADQDNYEGNGNVYATYGFQYQPGFDGAVSCNSGFPS